MMWLLNNPLFRWLGKWLVLAVGLVALRLGLRTKDRKEGAKDVLQEVKNADEKRAAAVRKRVADKRVQSDGGRKYRD